MPRKRTTAAEKMVIMRTLIVEGECSWNIKELEKAGTKKGVVTQSIKDTVQSLVDESLIDQDKIGAGSFFWSFASKNQLRAESKAKAATENLAILEQERKSLQNDLEKTMLTRNG